MDLGDILSKEQIITDLQAADRWQAIDELINNLVFTGKIKAEHRDAIAAVVKKRESSMSTGIGFGIGIPHASTDLIYEVVGSLGRSKNGRQLRCAGQPAGEPRHAFSCAAGAISETPSHACQYCEAAAQSRFSAGA